MARGTVIVDREGISRHIEIVPQPGQEPDYETAGRAASGLKQFVTVNLLRCAAQKVYGHELSRITLLETKP
ncbi:MAG: hypothetical protein IPJ33_13185 [Gammaproteobacteria bacterium]|nr:hypothetical protein [Gammaproteobacteria bacterium]MBK7729405.1 hypothetical protein [Gammaproteobacteria bacterium]